MARPLSTILLYAICAGMPAVAMGQVTRLEITSGEPAPPGRAVGAAGVYERIDGRVPGEVDPADRRNTIIQDIALAPRTIRGKVEHVATFSLMKPVDLSKSSGGLFYAVVNPIARAVTHAIATGTSQSGNLIKTFVHLGFNQDLEGRIVWDGVFPFIAARQTPIDFRFAAPGGAGTLYEPGSEPVLWWSRYADTVRGRPPVVTRAAEAQVRERFLLREDADRLVAQASDSRGLPPNAESTPEQRRIAEIACR